MTDVAVQHIGHKQSLQFIRVHIQEHDTFGSKRSQNTGMTTKSRNR